MTLCPVLLCQGSTGYNIFTAITATLVIGATLVFVLLLAFEVYRSVRFAALHDVARQVEAERVEQQFRAARKAKTPVKRKSSAATFFAELVPRKRSSVDRDALLAAAPSTAGPVNPPSRAGKRFSIMEVFNSRPRSRRSRVNLLTHVVTPDGDAVVGGAAGDAVRDQAAAVDARTVVSAAGLKVAPIVSSPARP